jgi:tyrosyl-tRNA synthetase
MHEILYPLAQAMDSVAIESDIELGGTDQKFNLLVGRDIQREFGIDPQIILTMPLLVGTDGIEKMSKSYDNYVGIDDKPKEMYGKILSIPDNLIYTYYELATNITVEELNSIKAALDNPDVNPRNLKRNLAKKLIAMYHSENEAEEAEREFDKIFIKKEIPDEIPEYFPPNEIKELNILDLIVNVNFAASKGEARRLVLQGGVSIDGNKLSDLQESITFDKEKVLKVGKRKFIKLLNVKEG